MFDSQSSDEHSSVQTVLARPQGGATLTGVTYVDDDPSDAETYDDGEEHHVTEAGEKPRDLDDVTAAADGWADVVEPEVDYVYATPRRTSAEDKEKDAAATADSLYPVTSTERPLSSTERPVSSCVTDNNSLRNGAVNLYEEPGERLIPPHVHTYMVLYGVVCSSYSVHHTVYTLHCTLYTVVLVYSVTVHLFTSDRA